MSFEGRAREEIGYGGDYEPHTPEVDEIEVSSGEEEKQSRSSSDREVALGMAAEIGRAHV